MGCRRQRRCSWWLCQPAGGHLYAPSVRRMELEQPLASRHSAVFCHVGRRYRLRGVLRAAVCHLSRRSFQRGRRFLRHGVQHRPRSALRNALHGELPVCARSAGALDAARRVVLLRLENGRWQRALCQALRRRQRYAAIPVYQRRVQPSDDDRTTCVAEGPRDPRALILHVSRLRNRAGRADPPCIHEHRRRGMGEG